MTGRNAASRLILLLLVGISVPAVAEQASHDGTQVHWAFVPPQRATVPEVQNPAWVRNPIDQFVLARLEERGLEPSPPASPATLIRRLSLDLRGLPPTTEEVSRFLADKRPGAYERLVTRMFASVHYGERWARHWLDVARYADSNGYTIDSAREIWRYRDWVIDALNSDLPFDEFVVEQLAGDLLPQATLAQRVATGFNRNTLFNEEGGTDPEEFRIESVADRVDTLGSARLGLTLGCARCHDHKYDPVSQKEYFQLFAFFNNCDEPKIDAPTAFEVTSGVLKKRRQIRARIEELKNEFRKTEYDRLSALLRDWEASLTAMLIAQQPYRVRRALEVPEASRTPEQQEDLENAFRKTKQARQTFPHFEQVDELQKSLPKISSSLVLAERQRPRATYVHLRGSFLDQGEQVQPQVLQVLHPLPTDVGRPNRLDLARWIGSPQNPLTARVAVNRFWQRLFGRGLVTSENDFGTQGEAPSHPELLDWLAIEFMTRDWSVRETLRLIVTSATYRQASRHPQDDDARSTRNSSDPETVDPDNRWLSRQVRLRLEAEIIRDLALATSGLLSPTVGGPSVFPPQPAGVFDFTQVTTKPWNVSGGPDRYRRGMYTFLWRSMPYPALMTFDFPKSNVTCTRRVRSNTPLQALTLANDPAFVECAQALGRRVAAEPPAEDPTRVTWLFQHCLARDPLAAERENLLQFVRGQRAEFKNHVDQARQLTDDQCADDRAVELATWTAAARVMMNLDEFITRE